jgi:hypothetical protein
MIKTGTGDMTKLVSWFRTDSQNGSKVTPARRNPQKAQPWAFAVSVDLKPTHDTSTPTTPKSLRKRSPTCTSIMIRQRRTDPKQTGLQSGQYDESRKVHHVNLCNQALTIVGVTALLTYTVSNVTFWMK